MKSVILIFSFLLCQFSLINGHNFTDKELLAYKASDKTSKTFPYYLAGHDSEGAPIWIWELGKWDFVPTVNAGGEDFDDADIATDQMFLRFRESGRAAPDKQGFNIIMDMDGYTLAKAADIKTLNIVISKFRKFGELVKSGDVKHGWIINASAVFINVLRLGAPLVGETANSFEVHGSNPAKWKPKLLALLPQNQLPEWYGGAKEFKPVKIYG